MSERYGTCKACAGKGYTLNVIHTDKNPTGFIVQKVFPNKSVEETTFEGKLMIMVARTMECGRCGGTGHCGDAMNLS